jgi:hypothetical protein
MVLLEKTNNEYSLIYSTKRIYNYFGITRSDYLHYISGKFPLEKLLETAEMTHEDFNTLISTNSLTLSAKNKQTGTVKQVLLNCEPYKHDGSNIYPIWVYDSSSKGNSIPGTATASQGNGTQAAPIIPTTGIFIRTFGHFDVFVDGTPVKFTSSKEKELMALLIDRNGGTISSREAISYLWEDEDNDEKVASRYRKLAMNLKNTLSKYGIEHILINNHGVRSIDVTAVTCDYYEMLGGNEKYQKTFHNIYMSDYSWAEDTLATLWEYS